MWKNKLFLKGLGIGLITAAILLQLMLTVKQADQGITKLPAQAQAESIGLDTETIKKKAEAAGLKVYEKDTKIYTQEQLDDAVRKAADTAKPPETAREAPGKQVTVYIYQGMTAVNVADYFFQSGVISNRDAFQNGLLKGKLEGKIRNGSYTFNLNENIEDVIHKLTTPPSWSNQTPR